MDPSQSINPVDRKPVNRRHNTASVDGAATTWEFPVADVLDHINWAFTEAVPADATSASENHMQLSLQSAALAPESCHSEQPANSQVPVNDLLAHVDNVFDNPLNLLNPVSREPVEPEPEGKFLRSSARFPEKLNKRGWPGLSSLYKVLKKFARLGKGVEEPPSSGTIMSLGKFILDEEAEKAISTIVDDGCAQSARFLTEQEDESLRDHLLPIKNQPGVAGYMLLGYDGLIVTHSLPEQMDPDSFSAWSLLTYMQAQQFTTAIGHKRMRQMIAKTDTGCVLLCAFGQALLVVISDNASTELIVPLLIKARSLKAA